MRVRCASESRLRLENRRGVKAFEGSNPSLSASSEFAMPPGRECPQHSLRAFFSSNPGCLEYVSMTHRGWPEPLSLALASTRGHQAGEAQAEKGEAAGFRNP